MIEEKNDLMKNIAGNSTNNMRKYLILGGGIFVLFVIGIVVSKFLFSSPKKENTSVILPPDIEQNKKPQKKEPLLFSDIPIENDNMDNKNDNFQKPKENIEVQNTQKTDNIKQNITKDDEKKPNIIDETKPNVADNKEVKKAKEETKTQVKEVKNKTTKKTNVIRNYYLQVAAVTRGNPAPKFLKLIKDNGFEYKIVEVDVKGMKVKRVLVGPFTYKEAKKALPKVKKKISSSAFIKRLK